MNLSKADREKVRLKCGGRCAYCGTELTGKWHADHVLPVERVGKWVFGKYVTTGEMGRPERDTLDNMLPACIPCNIDKSTFPLEEWRKKLERSHEVLLRNYATYKHALRFRLVVPQPPKVVFYFESYRPRRRINIT